MDQKVVSKIGKYEIVSELGQGGMGVVYKARDPFIGRLVALKTITPELVADPEILKRFYREAQSAGTLQHPNIVTIFDLGEADGHPYIAMEFVEGESLQKLITRRAGLPLAAKLKLLQQCCEGLGHAHKHGFVHRDVKPANILVTNDGTVKVVDFGIVHLETTNLTKTGMFLGTIHYASPEQINDGHVDSRSDLWSVACVAYELLAYKKAFDGSNITAIIAKVLNAEPEPLSQCVEGAPVELDQIISKGLKKNADERYQSLDEMLGDLLPVARRLQEGVIGDLLAEAKDLVSQGDLSGAQEKARAILFLDNTHGEGKRLYGEISTELQRQAPTTKVKKLVAEGEQALNRGEYAEALRIAGEAQGLNPADSQARVLRDKALQEQERAHELREGLTAGQRATKQGDLTGAEKELRRVLQIDQNNPQATSLLEQIRQDRLGRERDFKVKEGLWQSDKLISEQKYQEAQALLSQLLEESPASVEVQQKLKSLEPYVGPPKPGQVGRTAALAGDASLIGVPNIGAPRPPAPAAPAGAQGKPVAGSAPRPAPRPVPQKAPPSRAPLFVVAGIVLLLVLGIGGYMALHHHAAAPGPGTSPAEATQNEQQKAEQEKNLFDQAKAAEAAKNWDGAIALYSKVAELNGPMKDQALQAIPIVQALKQGTDIAKIEKDTFADASSALKKKDYPKASSLFQHVIDLKVPDSTLAPEAQAELTKIQPILQAKADFDAAAGAQNSGDLKNALTRFQTIAAGGGPFASEAKARIPKLNEMINNAGALEEFNAALQVAKTDPKGALPKFQAIAAGSGPFKADAQSHIQQINDQLAAADAKQQFDAADHAQSSGDLNGALAQFKALAAKPGPMQSQAQQRVQAITDQMSAAADKQKFDAADRAQSGGDLKSALAQFKALADRPGSMQSQAQAREQQVAQLIAESNKPAAAAPPPSSQPAPAAAHNAVVQLLPSGPYQAWTRPIQKGQIVPDNSVDGGLKPINDAMPAIPGASPGAYVVFIINIDADGNVSPTRYLSDNNGLSPQVMAAAKEWKFKPPTVRGKPVSTSISVKVTF